MKVRTCGFMEKALFNSIFKIIAVTLDTKFNPLLEIHAHTSPPIFLLEISQFPS